MPTGTVKWTSDEKKFGFISPSDGSPDLFAEYDAISFGERKLVENQKVEFEVISGAKGFQAVNIRPL